jgi:hypothetical protein
LHLNMALKLIYSIFQFLESVPNAKPRAKYCAGAQKPVTIFCCAIRGETEIRA